jgi:hypothetical protein
VIALNSNCLVFHLPSGEAIPLSADMVTVELELGKSDQVTDEFLRDATGAVFYYFKHDLLRQSVTLAEFSEALEKVIKGFRLQAENPCPEVLESDLGTLLNGCGSAWELVFFPRLRDELRRKLRQCPRVVRFRGLRGCVKTLAGVRRWSTRCEAVRNQILYFLRECLSAESHKQHLSIVVE